MSAASEDSGIEQVRRVLFGAERDALADLGDQVDGLSAVVRENQAALQALPQVLEQINEHLELLRTQQSRLSQQLTDLEALVAAPVDRTVAVSEVLVGAVSTVGEDVGVLGGVLQPEVEHALHGSARADSRVLAEALYPVLGPAMRKMIANLFTFGPASASGEPFLVSELLLIERSSGVLLAASHSDASRGNDSDIVSGMLDAIRMFVEQAFDSPEHDGLHDLRVGDTSVLVEWGPNAILASVIKGVPTNDYREAAAETLEQIHQEHRDALENFDGRVQSFAPATARLHALRQGASPKQSIAQRHSKALAFGIVGALVLLVVILILVL